MHIYSNARSVISDISPDEPVILNRPHAAARAARFFIEKFPGKSLYAVKANPSPDLLKILWDNGVTHYDVASIAEVRLTRAALPDAELCFMHPVKTARAVHEAYHLHGVRTFSLDCAEELHKIVTQCSDDRGVPADDLKLLVRLRVSSEYSEVSLAAKFGAELADVAELLQQTRQHCDWLGVCFHVGSQALTPFAYVQALERVRLAIAEAAVTVDIIDVGGGFPSIYPGSEPPPLEDFFGLIHRSSESLPISYSSELWCEPGRALCAEYSSVLVRVEKRRGNELYINDGAFGSLYDAAHLRWRFPTSRLSAREEEGRDHTNSAHSAQCGGGGGNAPADSAAAYVIPAREQMAKGSVVHSIQPSEEVEEFSFYGPTCDDADYMEGPFLLPSTIQAGDYIEIGMMGAYGATMKTGFNGFDAAHHVTVADEPMASLYRGEQRNLRKSDNVVSLR